MNISYYVYKKCLYLIMYASQQLHTLALSTNDTASNI